MSILGENLHREMERQGIKQEQLAAAVGVTQPAIAKIINGITLKPRNLPKIARALGVTVDSLLGIEEPKITSMSDNPRHTNSRRVARYPPTPPHRAYVVSLLNSQPISQKSQSRPHSGH